MSKREIDTRRHAAVSRRQNYVAAVIFQCVPIAVVWVVLVASSPAVKHWVEHDYLYAILITGAVLVVLDKALPWHLGGRRKPRW